MGNAKEAETTAAAAATDAPPPYEAAAAEAASSSAQQQPPKMKFPARLDGFYKIKLGLEGYLAETKDNPLYKLRWHPPQARRGNEPEHVLYDGASGVEGVDHKQLAGCRRLDQYGRQVQVILPPLPGSPHDHSSETMQAEAGFGGSGTCFRFSTEVGADRHREEFEWRPLTKDDDRSDLERKDGGYKLVRLASLLPSSSSSPSPSSSSEPEILAVGCRAPTWASLTKSYEFRFRGTSLTGQMGERFETAALVTAVQMWTFEFQTKLGQDPTRASGSHVIVV